MRMEWLDSLKEATIFLDVVGHVNRDCILVI